MSKKLKPTHRRFLRKPFGKLVNEKQALKLSSASSFTIAVGDATTLLLAKGNSLANVAVVDFLEKRHALSAMSKKLILSLYKKRFSASNPAGTITDSAASAVRKAISYCAKNGNALVVIKGEEDLVFLAALLSAPSGAMLFYGQPDKGVVAVKAGAASKKKAIRLLQKSFE